MKLNRCVSVAVFGYESLDDVMRSSQFHFSESESKRNHFQGEKVGFCHYLVNHFCATGGTTLDLTNDTEGLNFMNSLYSY